MDPLDKAIRAALEKGDASDPKHRERVYLSALSALERSLKSKPDLPAEAAAIRRDALRKRIRAIESEFRPAEPAQAEPDISATPAPPVMAPAASVPGAPAEGDFVSQLRVTRDGQDDGSPAETARQPGPGAGSTGIPRPRRRPYARMLSVSLLLVFAGMGGWWLYSSEALLPLSARDGAVPNPPGQLREDEFSPARPGRAGSPGSVSEAGSWITIFTPDDPTSVTAPSGTALDVTGEGRDKALRITPSATDSAAVFDLGEGLLTQLAGKRVTIDINAATPEGETTQISIRCSFAELGDCGRKRFDVEASRGDFLFEVELPDRAPGSFGSISLTPDISGGRTPVDIYSILVFIPDD